MILKSVIVDDENKSRNNLRDLLLEYCPAVEVVAEASSATEAFKVVNRYKPDLLFLDIELQDGTGFDVLKSLNGNSGIEVIFVTAFDKYGIQAVKSCAVDYLLKPINIFELIEAVEKAQIQIAPKKENTRLKELIANIDRKDEEKRIALPIGDKIEFVPVNNIIRFEADGNYTNIFMDSGKKLLVCKTLKEYHDLLENQNFIRTHQSHLINFKKIAAYVKSEGGYISMEDGTQIPISRQKREEVLSKILK